MTTQKTEAAVVSVPVAANYLDRSRSSLYEAIQSGEVPIVRIGGRIKIRRDVLEALTAGADPWEVAQRAREAIGC